MCPGYAGVLDDTVLEEIFADIFAGRVSEGKDVEFKEGFGWRSLAVYLKTMAGFANAEGGFLIFGVRDGSREPVGLDAGEARRFREMDGERVSTDLRSCFSREILWGFRLVSFGGREFGVIGVERGRVRPVVAIRDVGGCYPARGDLLPVSFADDLYWACGAGVDFGGGAAAVSGASFG